MIVFVLSLKNLYSFHHQGGEKLLFNNPYKLIKKKEIKKEEATQNSRKGCGKRKEYEIFVAKQIVSKLLVMFYFLIWEVVSCCSFYC